MHDLQTAHCPFIEPAAAPTRPTLIVLTASTVADEGKVFTIEGVECVLGRGAEANVRIDGQGISRAHAKITGDATGRFHLSDLQSRNGTYHNGVRVAEATLKDSDRIQIGNGTIFRFLLNGFADDSSVQQALAAAGMGTWSWSASTGKVTWSEQVERMLELPANSLVGIAEEWAARVSRDDLPAVQRALDHAAAHATPCELEFRVAISGQLRWWLCKGEVLAGQPVRIGGTVMDITVRKNTELELRRQALLFESLYDAVMVIDLNGTIIDWNSSAERMFGLPKEQVLGKLSSSVVEVADAAQLTRDMLAGLAEHGRWTKQLAFHYPDGRPGVCEAVVVPLMDTDGRRIANIGIHRDITEREQMQARLMLANRMASIGTLAVGMAHEINNPLAFITTNLNYLAREIASVAGLAPQAECAEWAGAVEDALSGARRIRNIVRDLRSAARGDVDNTTGPADLTQVLEFALNMANTELSQRVAVVRDFAAVPPVAGSESRLGQVFLHLLTNAAQAIPAGDGRHHEVRVACRTDAHGNAVVEITDTGIGIPAALIARVFDPFFTTRPVGTGTGLGLFLCHGIVESLGGEIAVESQEGRGTTFRVTLPASASATEPQLPDVKVGAPEVRARILVVDDEPKIGAAIQRLLARHYDLTIAARATDVPDMLARGRRFDVILCDLMMPEMNGMELFAAIESTHPEQAARIIFVTGGAFTTAADDYLRSSANPTILARKLYFPPRSITALPDGSGVYYARVLLDGNDLGVHDYTVDGPIVAVSPDGRRALSATSVYDVATGRRLGGLPVTTSALAISPDSTKVYLFSGSAIVPVDLTAF